MPRGLKVHAFFIDPQNDFMDTQDATLAVPGATEDMKRAARMLERLGRKIDKIHVTLDSHQKVHIANPLWLVDENGNHPAPFTPIPAQAIKAGIWRATNPALQAWTLSYTEQLEQQGKYVLFIWPPHCLIGTPGHNVQPDLNGALQDWAEHFATINYVTKGSNPYTEHYGGLMAEVVRPDDPTTALNTNFLQAISDADILVGAGEALSHCVLATVNQIADNIGPDQLKKLVLLTDCMSPVGQAPGSPDFPAISAAWLKDMEKRGVTLTTSTDFLA